MSDLSDLYQTVILDHNRRPRNRGKLPTAKRVASGDNPTCGDQCRVYLRLDGDRIAEISFDGSGCAISQATASLMTTQIKGKTAPKRRQLYQEFHEIVTTGKHRRRRFSDLAAFAGVHAFPGPDQMRHAWLARRAQRAEERRRQRTSEVTRPYRLPPHGAVLERCPRRFSDPAPAGQRQAARLSRQRRDDPEAARGHRRAAPITSATTATSTAGCMRSRCARPTPTRRTRPRGEIHQRRRSARKSFSPAARPKRSISSPQSWGAALTSSLATSFSSPRWSTTPTSCRGSWLAQRTGATLRYVPVLGRQRRKTARSRGARPIAHRRR